MIYENTKRTIKTLVAKLNGQLFKILNHLIKSLLKQQVRDFTDELWFVDSTNSSPSADSETKSHLKSEETKNLTKEEKKAGNKRKNPETYSGFETENAHNRTRYM